MFHLKTGSHIHFIGICGTGMAGLAGLLKEKGYKVTGSDQNFYPPMSNYIRRLSIPIMEGYSPKNLNPPPDLVIVGNVITRDNPEAKGLLETNIPYMSFPQALREFALKNKIPLVVAGTHGKTTTTSFLAWLLWTANKDPGFLVGGIPINFQKNFNIGSGQFFVIEGDEYDTAFFDKRPKFLHYMPHVALITSIEFDHADIYRDYEHVLGSFRSFVSLIPPDGLLVVHESCESKIKELNKTPFKLVTYGTDRNSDFVLKKIIYKKDTTSFLIQYKENSIEFETTLFGTHNLLNLTGAIAVGILLNLDPEVIKKAVYSFKGVKRRQEFVGSIDNITIIDDFAHHPTAVRETIRAIKKRYNCGRLIAVFEPRSNSSRRNVFQGIYPQSFSEADVVIIPEPKNLEKIPENERFSSKRLVEDLIKLGKEAYYFENTQDILNFLTLYLKSGDTVLFMSNGDFERLPFRLFESLVCRIHF